MADKIYLRGGLAAARPTLGEREPGWDTDAKKLWIGTASGNQGIVSSAPITPTWIAPTLLNGWVNFGGSYSPVGYYKDDLNIVHLRGLIKSGTISAGTILFNLPVGYRPNFIFSQVALANNAGTSTPFVIDIYGSGNVQIGTFPAGSTFLSLDSLQFRLEQ